MINSLGVCALAVHDDDGSGPNPPALYVGGDFSSAGGVANTSGIARWDGAAWSSVGNGVDSPGIVFSLAAYDLGTGPKLYAGGTFSAVRNSGGAAVSTANIARWDGTGWSDIGGTDGTVFALQGFDDGSGPQLFAGGSFGNAGTILSPHVARWNGSSWSPGLLTSVPAQSTSVRAFSVHDDGNGPALYAGGRFTLLARSIARWNGAGWSPLGDGIRGGNAIVFALATFDDGAGQMLYTGGSFLTAGGRFDPGFTSDGFIGPNLARWNGQWSIAARSQLPLSDAPLRETPCGGASRLPSRRRDVSPGLSPTVSILLKTSIRSGQAPPRTPMLSPEDGSAEIAPLRGANAMLQLSNLYGSIADDLSECSRIFRDELISDQGFISDICRHVDQFHGKQLRPALLLLSAQACGGVRREHHVLAAVVEMVHIATLVHDDVLDEADIRRRAATVNRLWGNERAVLTGDYLFSHAYHLCSGLSSQYAARIIGQTGITLTEGEMMQNVGRGNFDLTEAEYYDIISRKTASLIGVCGLLGAKYAGADDPTVQNLREFGESLGIAFQIIDDVLDLNGDEVETGKSLGRDVHKGKMTLPLIHYLRTCSPGQRQAALAILRGDDPQRYRQVARLLAGSESIEFANQAAQSYVAAAREALTDLPPSDARTSLDAMAEFVLSRRQ